MPRPRNPFPTPRFHKGRAVFDRYEGGVRRTVTLGPWGSPEAEREFARLMAEGPAAPRRGADATPNEVLLAFMRWAGGTTAGRTGRRRPRYGSIGTPSARFVSCTATSPRASSGRGCWPRCASG